MKESNATYAPPLATDPAPTNQKRGVTVGALVLIALCVTALIASPFLLERFNTLREELHRAEITMVGPILDHEYLADNPIDFATLQSQNPDIYAWLNVPGTDISQPILQSSNDDIDFYLNRDVAGNQNGIGEAYTQPYNTKAFDDPVTMVFGHSFEGTTDAFTNLHRLEDPVYFGANEFFYIYTSNRILTYRTIAAQEIPDDHILLNEPLGSAEGQQQYFDKLLNPTAEVSLVRDDITLIGGESKLVHLTTCTVPDKPSKRFIVTGLLVNEQKTK